MDWYVAGRISSLSRGWGHSPPLRDEKTGGKARTALNPWLIYYLSVIRKKAPPSMNSLIRRWRKIAL